ncbi:SHOCT domain-containing protein [Streptomyces endophyticus]|uniref:SHOCT domain-containing protein n=1 Tax=Streptomyces endophyticus TaxID=714166 RepID=A0ABU6F573_9ACTN|nr:SHOCT domain-containing protein [Streptomyces endophyticus]MEB8339146.1 SHOCT domain-containing protein [Streptomyces endophyticus]
MPQRFGRPGLLGTIARTAVISGTASAVSGRVNRRMADRDMRREMDEQARMAPPMQQAPPVAGGGDRVSQLQALAELKAQGLLTDAEFAAEKARVLNG